MPEQLAQRLEVYRDYLLLIARARINPKIRPRVGASDLVQKTLLDACAAAERYEFRGAEAELAWLRSILASHLAMAERDQRRQKRDLGREKSIEAELAKSSARLEKFLAADQSTPSQQAMKHELALAIAREILALGEKASQALILHYWQNWTLEAIGEHLQMSRFAVGRMMRASFKVLREKLKESE
jgi:RNA polymerase sigma-70 factor (ECF subfamily)